MYINYEYYRTFYYVALCQSVTAAAQLLHSSQPNVSRAIRLLEEELGTPLFLRSNRGVSLTPAGETLFAHVAPAVAQFQAAEAAVARGRGPAGGTVTLGASENAFHGMLPAVLGRFHRDYPGVRLRVFNHTTPQAIAALKAHRIDLALISTPTGAEGTLSETRLSPYRDIAVCGAALAHLAQAPRTLAELTAYPLVALGRDSGSHWLYTQLYQQKGLQFEPAFETATSDQVLPLVAAGLGVGFAPEVFAAEALARGEVLRIPLTEPLPQRYICLVQDESLPLSPAAQKLKEYLPGGRG